MFGREDDGGNDSLEVVSVAEDGRASPLSTIPIDGIEDARQAIPCASWAPDGRWAALGGGGSVWVVDTQTAEVRQLPVSDATDLEWRPGTDQLAITSQAWPNPNTPIDIYTVSTGELRTIDGVQAVQFTWSPDGTTIAYSQGVPGAADTMSGISLVDADGTNRRTLTTADWVEQGIGPVWSPRGDQIVYQRERADCSDPDCYERSEVILVTATDDDPDNPIGTERAIPPIPNDFYGEPGINPAVVVREQRHLVTGRHRAAVLRQPGPAAGSRRPRSTAHRALRRPGHQPVHRLHDQAVDRASGVAAGPVTGPTNPVPDTGFEPVASAV